MKLKLDTARLLKICLPVLGIAAGMLVGTAIFLLKGANPLVGYAALFRGALGNLENISDSLVKAVPLGLTGLAVVISYRAGIFNIGCEGQLQAGAIAAAFLGTQITGLPAALHVPLCVLGALAAGGLVALIPALAKAYRGYNETVITMLLNYIFLYLASYMVHGPLMEPGQNLPQSARLAESAMLPRLPGTRLHLGLVFLLAAAAGLYWLLGRSSFGFKVRASGFNPRAAFAAGIPSKSVMIRAMLLSGALAGLAGAVEIMGLHGRLIENFSPGYGYDAIAVALLAALHPLGVLLSAFFFGALRSGAASMQIVTGLPVTFVQIIQGVSVLFIVAATGMPRFLGRIRRARVC